MRSGHAQSRACDSRRLAAFLEETADEADREWVEQHLEHCHACRRSLYESVADEASWEEASRVLSSTPLDDEELSDEGAALSARLCADSNSDHELPDWFSRDDVQRVLQSLTPSDDPRMAGRLGAFEVEGVVGAGGMGVVLKGYDASLGRHVAIKVLPPRLASVGGARRRFAREARAAAAVVHPHVIGIHLVATEGPLPYFVMPFVRGHSLQRRLELHGPLSVAEALRIAAQAAGGLAAAHAQGLVHRDIKPANLLLEEGVERVAVTDFGLARTMDDATMSISGVIAGTPQYMSPEQARGEPLDARSDLFSLGSVLYAMLTGHSPFRAATTVGVLRRIVEDSPRPLREANADVPEWLENLVSRLLAKEARDRIASAEAAGALLERCLAHVQDPTRHPLPEILRSPPTPRGIRRLGAVLLRGVLVLAAFAAFVGFFGPPATRPPRPFADIPTNPAPPLADSAADVLDDWGESDCAALEALDADLSRLESSTNSAP